MTLKLCYYERIKVNKAAASLDKLDSKEPEASIDWRDSKLGFFLDKNKTDIYRLRQDLLKDYDKNARPSDNSLKTRCEVGLSLLHIDLDETRGILTSHTWMRMTWSDPLLAWDNSSYNNISSVHFQADEVFQLNIYD